MINCNYGFLDGHGIGLCGEIEHVFLVFCSKPGIGSNQGYWLMC